MVHAFIGLLIYEEKDGRLSSGIAKYDKFWLSTGNAEKETVIIPRLFRLLPGSEKKATKHFDEAAESLENELPEAHSYHLAELRDPPKKRKRKTIQTPFGRFTITDMFGTVSNFAAF